MIRRPEARGRAITRPVAHDLAMHGHGTIRQVAREDEVDALVERLLRIEEIGSLAAREARRLAVRCLPAIREPRPEHHPVGRSEEHTSELQSQSNLVCRLLLEKKKQTTVSR